MGHDDVAVYDGGWSEWGNACNFRSALTGERRGRESGAPAPLRPLRK
jgi:hypothetical protein